MVGHLKPNRYELATGLVPGADPAVGPLPSAKQGGDARAALEQAVLGPLRRPPCVVSFSGGLDSSAVLAVAVLVARREGLPLPVPVTLRFPAAEGADETGWQEQVVHHLGLHDWERISLTHELDFLGPIASDVLCRHGLLWPANAYFHVPMLRRATGGSLLTGVDGDVLFGGWRWARLANRPPAPERLRQHAAYLAQATVAAAPPRPRLLAGRARIRRPTWVRPSAWPEVAGFLASRWELEPRRWDVRVAWWWRRRYLSYGRWSLSLLANDAKVDLVHPLLDPGFLASLAREGGQRGFASRGDAMRALFSDVLPPALLSRRSKAYFDRALWGPHSREFISQWRGAGVDASLVDPALLGAEWSKSMPHLGTACLLQSAWLETAGRRTSPNDQGGDGARAGG